MECNRCEGKGKLPLFSTRFGFTNDRYHPCPTCDGTGEEDQMENNRSPIHHIIGIGEGATTEIENIVEVKMESVDIKEPDPIKVGDEVEYSGLLDYGYETGIVEGTRYSRLNDYREYKIDGLWLSDNTYSIRKKVDEEDILHVTVEEVISGGMNSAATNSASILRTPEEIIESVKEMKEIVVGEDKTTINSDEVNRWRNLVEKQGIIVIPPCNDMKIEKIDQAVAKKHQTTIDEDLMNFLIED